MIPDPAPPDLEQWMIRYQQADPAAPELLVTALSPRLQRFFASQFGTREDAADLVQDTWIRIHRVRHTYRPGEPVLPWIFAIARRAGIDGFRKRRRVRLHEEAVEAIPEQRHKEGAPVAASIDFEGLMAQLPESQREVVTMLKVGGLSLEEIARATSSTVGSVKQKAHRAYSRLREILEERR